MQDRINPPFDFAHWLSLVDTVHHEDVHDLYESVRLHDQFGMFECRPSQTNRHLSVVRADGHDEPLLLVSAKARTAFLALLERTYCEDMTMEGWYAYRRAMAKDD